MTMKVDAESLIETQNDIVKRLQSRVKEATETGLSGGTLKDLDAALADLSAALTTAIAGLKDLETLQANQDSNSNAIERC